MQEQYENCKSILKLMYGHANNIIFIIKLFWDNLTNLVKTNTQNYVCMYVMTVAIISKNK